MTTIKQFTIRVPENLAKLDRVEKIYQRQGSRYAENSLRYLRRGQKTLQIGCRKIRRLYLAL